MRMRRAVIPIILVVLLFTLGLGTSEVAGLQASGGEMVAFQGLSLNVQKNGWAQVEYKVLFNKQAIAEWWGLSLEEVEEVDEIVDEMLDEFKKGAEENGWRVTSYSEGGMVGLKITKHVSLVEVKDLSQIFEPDFSTEQVGPLLVIDKGFFYTRYRLATDFNLGNLVGHPATWQLRLTLPGKVTRHNADEEEDKTLIWDVSWGQDSIEAEARAVNLEALALVIIIVVGALGGAFFAISRLSKPLAPATLPKGAKFCCQCGSPISPGDAFCLNCGGKVNA